MGRRCSAQVSLNTSRSTAAQTRSSSTTPTAAPDKDLRLQFEAASAKLDEKGKQLVRALIKGVLFRHEARRWANAG